MPKRKVQKKNTDWHAMSRQYLFGETWGDQYVLRPVPIPSEFVPWRAQKFLDSQTPASLWKCGPKPWPDPVHLAVAVLRGYFCKEMGGGPYLGFEGTVPTYLIVMPDDANVWTLGILGFEYFGPEHLPFGNGHALMYTWVHPLFRRKGLMESALREASDDVGLFCCQRPISRGMREVLKRLDHPQANDETNVDLHGGNYR